MKVRREKYRDLLEIDVLNNTIRLEDYCWACGDSWYSDPECDHCDGSGIEPTDNGQAILDLIRLHKEQQK